MAYKRKSKKSKTDKFQQITNQLIEQLEQGVKPWAKPWFSTKGFMNLVGGNAYRGGNPMFLAVQMLAQGFDRPLFVGYKQAESKGWQVKKGSKACYVKYASSFKYKEENDDGDMEEKRGFSVKWIPVFNITQLDDSEADESVQDFIDRKYGEQVNPDQPNKSLEQFLADTEADIHHGGGQAFYRPSTDEIHLPVFNDFTGADAYYATALHELTHWTGHDSRCDRSLKGRFGTPGYAQEELVAELGAAFLCGEFGIESTLENHASYLDSWLGALKDDKKYFFKAVRQAEQAASFLMELTGLEQVTEEVEAEEKEPALA